MQPQDKGAATGRLLDPWHALLLAVRETSVGEPVLFSPVHASNTDSVTTRHKVLQIVATTEFLLKFAS